jgi:glycosyltransferase involved in cell wall biosynthesis
MGGRHIAVLSTSFPDHPGDPAGHFVASECRALRAAGHRITVVTAASGAAENEGVELIGVGGRAAFGSPGALVRLRQNPLRAFSAAKFCFSARRVLNRLDVDEVVAHWLIPSLLIVGTRRYPVTGIAHGSDVDLLTRLPPALLRRTVARWLDDGVQFRFVADRLRDDLVAACGRNVGERLSSRAIVEPCVVDVSGVPERAEARKRLKLDERFLAVSVGRLVSGKRVDWALAHAPVPASARWVVIGDGPERGGLQSQFPHVEFLGALDRNCALTWIAAADVLVCASEREGAPTVVREARQLGTLVWTNDVGDVRRWARDDPGIVVMDRLSPTPRRGGKA